VRKTPLLVVFLTVFVDLLGFGIVIPFLPMYAQDLGATGLVAGLVLSTFSFMQFLFAPMWGRLSDRLGRRPVLLVTLAGGALSYVLFAFARDLGTVFAARALAGFFGANIPVAQAYVADVTTPENRARGMGLLGMAFGLGFVFGPAVGGLLAEVAIWAPGAAAATLSGTAFFLALFRLPESLAPEVRSLASTRRAHPILFLGTALRTPAVGGILLLFFFLVAGFVHLEFAVPFLLRDRFDFDKKDVGLVFVFIGLCMAFAQGFLFRRVAARFGEPRLLRAGPVAIAIGMQLYWILPAWPMLLPAIALVAVGMGVSNPSIPSLISKRTPPDVQGQTLGLSQSLGALARAVGPFLAGWLYDDFKVAGGWSYAPFVAGAAFVLLGVALGWRSIADGADTPAVAVARPPAVG
jgi:multidrug resistance protein